MTAPQSRIAAGVPAGGEFAAHDRADAAVALTRDGGPIRAAELRKGDVIHHGSTTLRAGEVTTGDVVTVECELGTLTMNPDTEVVVARTGANVIAIDADAPSADEFLAVFGGGLNRSEILGDYFTRDSVDSALFNAADIAFPSAHEWTSDEAEDAADEWLTSPESRDEVWDALRETERWNQVDRNGYGPSSYDELESETYTVVAALMREKGWIR